MWQPHNGDMEKLKDWREISMDQRPETLSAKLQGCTEACI